MTTFHWENIVRCVVRNVRLFPTTRNRLSPMWHAVAEICGLGSTSAIALCRVMGIDPHEKMPECELNEVAQRCGKEMDDETQGPSETCSKMWDHIEQAITQR